MGPALLVALLGLVLALIQRSHADKILAAFVLAYFATLLPLDAHFDRYVLPLVLALGALAGRVRALASVTLLLLVIPLVWSIGDARELAKTATRVVAHDWMEANLTPGVLVAADPSTATPDTVRVHRLALPGPGRPPDPERDVARLRRMGVGYVVVTGAVADGCGGRRRYPRTPASTNSSSNRGTGASTRRRRATGGALGSGVRAVEGSLVAIRRHGFAVAGAVFVSGAVVLGMEIAASRVLAPFFGNSLFVWGSLIGIVLAGLAIGYWAGGILADRWPEPRLLAAVMGLGARVLAIPVLDGPVLEAIVEWDPGPRLNPLLAAIALFGAPSIILAGVAPIAVRLHAQSLANLGQTAGRLFRHLDRGLDRRHLRDSVLAHSGVRH